MSFLHPHFLPLLGLVVLPILLHLLKKRERVTIPLATLRFMQEQTRPRWRFQPPDEALKLLVRIAMIASLVGAIGHPILPKKVVQEPMHLDLSKLAEKDLLLELAKAIENEKMDTLYCKLVQNQLKDLSWFPRSVPMVVEVVASESKREDIEQKVWPAELHFPSEMIEAQKEDILTVLNRAAEHTNLAWKWTNEDDQTLQIHVSPANVTDVSLNINPGQVPRLDIAFSDTSPTLFAALLTPLSQLSNTSKEWFPAVGNRFVLPPTQVRQEPYHSLQSVLFALLLLLWWTERRMK